MERDIHDKQVIKTALHSKVPTSRRVDKINTNQPTNEATTMTTRATKVSNLRWFG